MVAHSFKVYVPPHGFLLVEHLILRFQQIPFRLLLDPLPLQDVGDVNILLTVRVLLNGLHPERAPRVVPRNVRNSGALVRDQWLMVALTFLPGRHADDCARVPEQKIVRRSTPMTVKSKDTVIHTNIYITALLKFLNS